MPNIEIGNEEVPDLYRLAFMPGSFKCEKCEFVLVKSSFNASTGQIGTFPEDRQSEECPNCPDVFLKHLTYRDALKSYETSFYDVLEISERLRVRLAEAEALIEDLYPSASGFGDRVKSFLESKALTAPPRHAVEVNIKISGEDWNYIYEHVEEIAQYIKERGPQASLISGGAGGSHYVHIARRDVSPAAFRQELEQWLKSLRSTEESHA